MLLPRAAGIDISDASIKWLAFDGGLGEMRIHSYGEESLGEGIVVNGIVQDPSRLTEALARAKERLHGIDCIHAALPEEAAYVFSMHVPKDSSREQILSVIEFELEGRVPIPPAAAVYDFNRIPPSDSDSAGEEIGVAVFPRELAESYVGAFSGAGLRLLSLEVEAGSIARAVSSGRADEPITLLVDFGRRRTGFAVLKHGIPIFTSTVSVGGEAMTQAVMKELSLSAEEAEAFKDNKGLLVEHADKRVEKVPGIEALSGAASALADEVVRHYHYWDTRRDERGERMTPIERVFLVGGTSNLRGLADYIAARVQAPTVRPDVWQNVCSFNEYIPPIDRPTSLQFATAVGLALRGLPIMPAHVKQVEGTVRAGI
jgi:type IV pilus assembly protein PilM